MTHAERIGPGTTKPRPASATTTSAALNTTPGHGRVVGRRPRRRTRRRATTTNAPAAAPSTCANPGRGRRCDRASPRPGSTGHAVGHRSSRRLDRVGVGVRRWAAGGGAVHPSCHRWRPAARRPPSPLRYAPTTRPADASSPRKMPILRSFETPMPPMSTPPVLGPTITLMRMNTKATTPPPRYDLAPADAAERRAARRPSASRRSRRPTQQRRRSRRAMPAQREGSRRSCDVATNGPSSRSRSQGKKEKIRSRIAADRR